MLKHLYDIASILLFFGVGLYCLLGAKRMQRRAIEASDKYNRRLFRGYIRSRSYVVVARITGVLSIGIALLLLFLLFRG